MSTFIMTIVTDILVLAIPIWAFIGLNVNLATRITVIMIFLTSGFVTIIGILRVIAFSRFFWDPNYDFGNTWGPSYSAIEINLAITAACIPALRPLLRRWFPQLFRNASSEQSGPYQQQRYCGEGRSTNSNSMRLGSLGQTRADLRSGAPSSTDSQEEIFKSNPIMKPTNVRRGASSNIPIEYADKLQVNYCYCDRTS
ncbi:hypothetical protein KVR01_000679 [Diaporthe batatas]|uniref:uncharacterized protein n=1 Tax=Diaporthe batatas TaxID=748121 RepID=UPI001D043E30|nr:uncharacterized protein KVR01_000679 [Diaporthe batatas]KAG8169934.1 hypothetical protein KVR01_000679 [Diaporthe batatas]